MVDVLFYYSMGRRCNIVGGVMLGYGECYMSSFCVERYKLWQKKSLLQQVWYSSTAYFLS